MNSQLLWEKRHRRRWFTFSFYYYWVKRKALFVLNGFKTKAYSLSELASLKRPNFRSRVARFKKQTDPFAWKLLAELVKETNSKVCISSVWRAYFTVPEWNIVFNMLGIGPDVVIGVTGWRESCRGEEIRIWLSSQEGVTNFAIIDDDNDMLNSQMSHFFLTDGYCGLSPSIVYRIKRLFNS